MIFFYYNFSLQEFELKVFTETPHVFAVAVMLESDHTQSLSSAVVVLRVERSPGKISREKYKGPRCGLWTKNNGL